MRLLMCIIFLSLFFPCDLDNNSTTIEKKQVRFIIGTNFIFTARSNDIRGFYDLKKKIRRNKTNPIDTFPNPTAPLTELLQEVYRHIGDDLEGLSKSLAYTEKHILSHKDISKHVVYEMNKKTEDVHSILATQETVWEAFDSLCKEFFNDIHTNDTLGMVMSQYKKTYKKSEKNTSKKIDQKLLFRRSLTRKKRIRKIQISAFLIVFVTLLVVGSKAF